MVSQTLGHVDTNTKLEAKPSVRTAHISKMFVNLKPNLPSQDREVLVYVCVHVYMYLCMYVCGNQPTSEVLYKSISQIQYVCMYVCMNVCMRHTVNKINNGNRIWWTLQDHHWTLLCYISLLSPLSYIALSYALPDNLPVSRSPARLFASSRSTLCSSTSRAMKSTWTAHYR